MLLNNENCIKILLGRYDRASIFDYFDIRMIILVNIIFAYKMDINYVSILSLYFLISDVYGCV